MTAPSDLERRVVEAVENVISELMVIGLERDAAIKMLLIQSAVRLPDAATIRKALGAWLVD